MREKPAQRVYFIKPVGMDGPIKIGCSQSPETRRSSLETWSPFALEIVATIDGDYLLERRFHAHFIHLHERREWFRSAPELHAAIAEINAGTFDLSALPEPRRVDGLNTSRSWRTPEFSRQLSYSLRLTHMEHRSGYRCPVRCRDMVKRNDVERIAVVDAYLADPAQHGVPIEAAWAAKRRAERNAS